MSIPRIVHSRGIYHCGPLWFRKTQYKVAGKHQWLVFDGRRANNRVVAFCDSLTELKSRLDQLINNPTPEERDGPATAVPPG